MTRLQVIDSSSLWLPLLTCMEFIRQSAAQLATKQPCVEPTHATLADLATLSFQPSSSFAPSSSSRATVSLADIMEQL